MGDWGLQLHCPKCSGDLTFVNGSRHANEIGSLTVAVVLCDPCGSQYEINVRLRPMAWTSAEVNEQQRARAEARKASA